MLSDYVLDISLPPAFGYVHEGTLDGSRVRVRRVGMYPEEDPQEASEVCTQCRVVPFSVSDESQTFRQVAVAWRYLEHPNIVPLLGVTIDPLQLISDWMPGGDLTEYIMNNPDADRLKLVGVPSTALYDELTPSPAI